MNDIWITRTPALGDPAGAEEERRYRGDSNGLRQNPYGRRMMGNSCCLCALRGFTAEPLTTVQPSAPGKVKFVYPRSSGDVVIHWTGAEGLAYDLCPFGLFSPLSLSPTGFLYCVQTKKYTSENTQGLTFLKPRQFQLRATEHL